MTDTEIAPDLPGWIQDHLRRYLESDGEDGHLWDSSAAGGRGVQEGSGAVVVLSGSARE